MVAGNQRCWAGDRGSLGRDADALHRFKTRRLPIRSGHSVPLVIVLRIPEGAVTL